MERDKMIKILLKDIEDRLFYLDMTAEERNTILNKELLSLYEKPDCVLQSMIINI